MLTPSEHVLGTTRATRLLWSPWSWTVLVMVLGLSTTLAVANAVNERERQAADVAIDRRAELIRTAVQDQAGRYVQQLRSVAAAAGAFDSFTADKFAQVTEPLASMRFAGATSIAFLVPARADELGAVEAEWRARGVPDLRLSPAGPGPEHIFSVFSQPLDGSTQPRRGIDASQAPAPAAALVKARATGQVTVSDAYELLLDRDLPPDQRQRSFSIVAPVWTTSDDGSRAFVGWVLMGVRGRDFIGATLADAAQGDVDVTMSATRIDGKPVRVAEHLTPTTGERDERRVVDAVVAQRAWRLEIAAVSSALPGSTALSRVLLVAGIALTAAGAALVFLVMDGRRRAELRVAEATAELHAQSRLLDTVLNSIGDGVSVVDDDRRFVLHNRAARRLLDLRDDVPASAGSVGSMAVFDPERGEPLATEQLPIVRALHGETTDEQDLVVRQGPHAEARVLAVSARPLDHQAPVRGAVAVFRDVTARRRAEEALRESRAALERANADLHRFAGTASHDLRAPLATIAGFSELLALEYGGQLDAQAREYLRYIDQNARHLTGLIESLLELSRVTDETLSRQPVDLNAVVGRVVFQLATTIRSTSTRVTTEHLPVVSGDAGLLERLVLNLVGNAIKYQPAGQPPEVRISATPPADGVVTIRVTDNGIGIPRDRADEIFEPFRRLHDGERSYTGHGLGLAVCQRIVERHDGHIWAEPNEGPGTTIAWTMAVDTSGRLAADPDETIVLDG